MWVWLLLLCGSGGLEDMASPEKVQVGWLRPVWGTPTCCLLQVPPKPALWALLLALLGTAPSRAQSSACSVPDVLRHYRAIIFEDLQAAKRWGRTGTERTRPGSRHFHFIQKNLTRPGGSGQGRRPGASCGAQKEHSILLSISSLGRTLRRAVAGGRRGALERAAWTVAVRTEAVMRRHCRTPRQVGAGGPRRAVLGVAAAGGSSCCAPWTPSPPAGRSSSHCAPRPPGAPSAARPGPASSERPAREKQRGRGRSWRRASFCRPVGDLGPSLDAARVPRRAPGLEKGARPAAAGSRRRRALHAPKASINGVGAAGPALPSRASVGLGPPRVCASTAGSGGGERGTGTSRRTWTGRSRRSQPRAAEGGRGTLGSLRLGALLAAGRRADRGTPGAPKTSRIRPAPLWTGAGWKLRGGEGWTW
ncbi:hypothetical protein AAY473_035997 [Plecturocebus cupreus]